LQEKYFWDFLDLSATGDTPLFEWCHKDYFGGCLMGAKIYEANNFWIKCPCGMAHSPHSFDLKKVVTAWNTRSTRNKARLTPK
jgi:hypothetical protein